jgi:hypothetical protein
MLQITEEDFFKKKIFLERKKRKYEQEFGEKQSVVVAHL